PILPARRSSCRSSSGRSSSRCASLRSCPASSAASLPRSSPPSSRSRRTPPTTTSKRSTEKPVSARGVSSSRASPGRHPPPARARPDEAAANEPRREKPPRREDEAASRMRTLSGAGLVAAAHAAHAVVAADEGEVRDAEVEGHVAAVVARHLELDVLDRRELEGPRRGHPVTLREVLPVEGVGALGDV